jgi:23S rRNA (cytidine2498-2'-O)-methyltransferase
MRALDLGAAPGGWTGVLVARGLRVHAVDTAPLVPQLAQAPGVTAVRGTVQRAPLPAGPFDLLCADLSWDPLRSADAACRFAPCLRPGAHGILTVKFFGPDPLETIRAVRERLAPAYRVEAVRHLFHNRAEATAHLRRIGG